MQDGSVSRRIFETVEVPRLPTTVTTANGSIATTDEAIVNVEDLDIFDTVQLLEDTPAVLFLGKFIEENGYSYEWKDGQTPNLFENDKTAPCKCDNSVHLVVSGRSGEAHLTISAEESAESIKELTPDEQETTLAPRKRSEDSPEWLEEIHGKLGGTKINIFWQ